MRLNMYIIKDYLKLDILDEHLASDRNICGFQDVTFFDLAQPVKADVLYIVTKEDFSEKRIMSVKGSFLFIKGVNRKKIEHFRGDFLVLDTEDERLLLQEVQRVFQMFREWELELYRLLYKQVSLKKLAATSYSFLENPLCLYTPSLKAIFFSNDKKFVANPKYHLNDREGEYLSKDYMDLLRFDPGYRKTVDMVEPEIFPADIFGYRTLYYNIRLKEIYIARIVVCEIDRPIRESDFAILKFLASFIREAMQRQTIQMDSHPPYLDACLMELIQSQEPLLPHFDEALHDYGWKMHDRYVCVYLPVSDTELALHTVPAVCCRLEGAYPRCAAVSMGAYIVFFVNLDQLNQTRERFLLSITSILKESLLKIGVSNEFNDLLDLFSYFQQAKAAYELGSGKDSRLWYYCYENYMLEHVLARAGGQESVLSLCPPGLLALMQYDLVHHTSFTLSLKAYLENNMSTAKTIQKLYIQRPTFLYQLKRIREISGLQLDEKDERLYLLVYFRILDIKGIVPLDLIS